MQPFSQMLKITPEIFLVLCGGNNVLRCVVSVVMITTSGPDLWMALGNTFRLPIRESTLVIYLGTNNFHCFIEDFLA